MSAFWVAAANAFGLVGVAELGDKSQLLCLTLAAAWGPRPVWLGASAAFVALNALAVTLGALISRAVPELWLDLVAGALFGGFGLWTLRSAGASEETAAPVAGRSAVWSTFVLMIGAEMGDKTQLTVAGLAAIADPLGTFVGASLALIAVSGLGTLAGGWVERRLSRKWVERIAAAAFVTLGVLRLIHAVRVHGHG